MEQKIPPKGETAQYRRTTDGLLVDVDMVLAEGRWYARLWNDNAVLDLGEPFDELPGMRIPASPWYLELSSFGKRYEPVAPPPKIG